MKNAIPKITFLATISIALIIALVAILAEFFFTIITFSLLVKFFIWIILALILAILITAGFLAFSPGFSNAILALKKITRFENLSHPLLLRLAYEAPGTFHHSINVSILAQKAARAIGADSLLVRVVAYYHDIGKLDDPILFIENQSGSEIPNIESAEYIRGTSNKIIRHVEKGIKLALEHHLPEEIVDLIGQHHGTTRVLYFHEIAKEKGLKIKKTDFRYAGPIPQSREAAILMLADSVEAATRATYNNMTAEDMRQIVDSTIEDKVNEKQLKNSQLSESDIAVLKNSFIETLGSIYHRRLVR